MRTAGSGNFLRLRVPHYVCLSIIAVALAWVVLAGCNVRRVNRTLVTPENARTLDKNSPYLKAHMLNGGLYVLRSWNVDESNRLVSGSGTYLDPSRQVQDTAQYVLGLDSVALFETNTLSMSPSVASMAVMTGVSAALTIVCITSPKTCFGSCPTFYVTDGDEDLLQAEGFSASIAPALEATDLDALYRAVPSSRDLKIAMTNEALETHVVQYVKLLAVRRPRDGRVVKDVLGSFWEVSDLAVPAHCIGEEGDFTPIVQAFDNTERFSLADSNDLAAHEDIEITFQPRPGAEIGLLVGARQSFVSTFLFYQLLAYAGSHTTDLLSALERGDKRTAELAGSLGNILGRIEVHGYTANGVTVRIGEIGETGPLATDLWMIQLPDSLAQSGRLKLSMARGSWRLNYLALARIGEPVNPTHLQPVTVWHDGDDPEARRRLVDSTDYLVTLPGDRYEMTFELPPDFASYELFLESRGYYLEWMRQEWLAEENVLRAAWVLGNPEQALKELAPEYKKYEPEIEQLFWNSRYVR